MKGTSRGLAAAAAMAMVGLAASSSAQVVRAPSRHSLRTPGVVQYDPNRKVGDAQNKRARGAGMAAKRAAQKRRNVIRHRKACRG